MPNAEQVNLATESFRMLADATRVTAVSAAAGPVVTGVSGRTARSPRRPRSASTWPSSAAAERYSAGGAFVWARRCDGPGDGGAQRRPRGVGGAVGVALHGLGGPPQRLALPARDLHQAAQEGRGGVAGVHQLPDTAPALAGALLEQPDAVVVSATALVRVARHAPAPMGWPAPAATTPAAGHDRHGTAEPWFRTLPHRRHNPGYDNRAWPLPPPPTPRPQLQALSDRTAGG